MNAPDLPSPVGPGLPPPGRALVEREPGLPIPAPPQSPAPEGEPDGEVIDLRELWEVMVKRRWTIIVFTAIVVVAAVTATYLMTPIYRASLTLQIDREDIKVVKIEEVAPVDASTGQDYLQTQYELLKSRSLAQRVIDQMGLANRLEQAPPPSPLAQARDWLELWLTRGGADQEAQPDRATPDPAAENARIEGVITDFLRALTVEPIRNSRLVRLYYQSPDPQLATTILNNLAKSYINLNLERRFDASTYARNFLQERLQQVKAKLEESERDLVEISRREEIIAIDQKESVITGNLTAASAALIEAGQKRMEAEAIYRQMQATRGQGLTQVLESKIIQDLKQTKAKLEAQYQDDLSTYKPAYPNMVELRNQIKQVDAMINEEVGNIRAAITSNFEAAKSEEAMLRTNLQQMKQEVLSLQSRSIPLTILRRESDTNRQLYEGLLQRYKEVGVAAGIGTNNISVVDQAKVPSRPYKPSLRLNALLALVLGLLGGVGLAFLFEHLDDSFRRPEELERLLGLPLLGVIAKVPQALGDNRALALIGHDDPRSAFAEAYRSLRTALQFSTANGVPRLLAVTSAMAGEGKSTSALSLAIQFAQSGRRTLLIDADLRKPSLHTMLTLDSQTGLTNYLAGGEAQPAEITRPTHIANLFAIPCGPLPPNPGELLASARMLELLTLAAERFDQVIVDSPPVLGLADALIIGNLCEGTLLTIAMGSTSRSYVQGAVKRLRGARVPLLGTILTKLEAGAGGYGYYRSYYYQSYYQSSNYSGAERATESQNLATRNPV
jgi:polysaccharide biosynthesis transport protein